MGKWVAILILLGVLSRCIGALWFSGNYSMDHAVPCLMAKHIVEGKPWPMFYYGQPYMGSIESLVSALFYRLPIDKNFACNLGTAFFGMLFLPLVWYWGRGSGCRSGGFAALSLVVIGPPVYMQFMNWSYGGYAAVTFFQTALITAAIMIVKQERLRSGSASLWQWSLLGLAAGMGWWTSPMIIPGILATALLMVMLLGRRCFQKRLLVAAVVFIVGSLPLWWWNLHNDWQTIAFLRRGSGGEFMDGLAKFLPGLLFAVSGETAPWTVVLGSLVALCVVYSAIVVFRERKSNDLAIHHLAAWLVLLTAAFFFASKPERIGPARYFLPLVPAIAVLVGHAVAVINRKVHRYAGWSLLLLLVVDQARILPIYAGWYQSRHVLFADLDNLRDCLEQLDTDVLYGTYTHRTRGYGLNFYYDEDVRFVDFPFHERQPAYSRAVELVKHPAVFNHLGHIIEFLRASGGAADYISCIPDGHITHRFRPPPDDLAPVEDGFSLVDVATGNDITRMLSDHHHGTYWVNNRFRNGKTVEARFDAPVRIDSIRLFAEENARPSRVRVDVMRPGEAVWRPIANEPFTVWFWSGDRPYPRGTHYRQEFRINGGEVTAMRIELGDEETDRQIRLSELQFFTMQPEAWPQRRDIHALIQFLQERRIAHIHSDRWEANQLYLNGPEGWRLSLDALVFRREPRRLESRIDLREPTALVLHPRDAPASRAALQRMGIAFEEADIAGWSIILPTVSTRVTGSQSTLKWTGVGVVIDPTLDWADSHVALAQEEIRMGRHDAAGDMIEQVLDVWPSHASTLAVAVELARLRGDQREAERFQGELHRLTEPAYFVRAQFGNHIELIGMNAPKLDVTPGEVFDYEVLWRIPQDVDVNYLAMFLHVVGEDGNIRFQGDRVMNDDRRFERVDGERILEQRTMVLPKDAQPGIYSFRLGIYDANPPHDKVRVRKAQVPFKRGYVELPMVMAVR